MLDSRRLTLAAGCVLGLAVSTPLSAASLQQNRDRLLDTYAQRLNKTRCQTWIDMTQVQKGVFLTITDLLGKRSFLYNAVSVYQKAVSDSCSEVNSDCTYGCSVWNPEWQYCQWMSGIDCASAGACSYVDQQRTNYETALDHVTRIYAVNGNGCPASNPSCECGGGDNHRLFFGADDALIGMIRNFDFGLPEWHDSEDLAGAHAPFNNSSETLTKMARAWPFSAAGQMHFWRWDYEAQYLNRPGVYGVYDPHVVELDIDYAILGHPSNPECSYGGTYGRAKYEQIFWNKGFGGSAEYGYAPASCVGPGTCGAMPPVGAGNLNAFYAGYYDYYCGYNKATYGYDPSGYCALANQSAAAAGVNTLATGTCTGGASAYSNAGYYNYYCRWAEYNGYGWDYNGMCTAATTASANGGCSGNCGGGGGGGGCVPTSCAAQGRTCGNASDGCGGTLFCGSCPAGYACNGSGQCQATAVCNNGACEAGENGSSCGADCCDSWTACGQTYRNQGVQYCRSINGGSYQWYSAWNSQGWPSVEPYCDEPWEVNSSTFACGGSWGECCSIPNGWWYGGC